MRQITLEELLEAGCHFGHQVIRSNPKARDFVFEAREGIQIIDLAKTKEGLDAAAEYAKKLGSAGAKLLVVATKKQAKQVVEEQTERVRELFKELGTDYQGGIFYITQRWIGGTLTNFSEVSKNLKKLEELNKKLVSEEEKSKYTKKEIGLWEKETKRLLFFYKGIADMKDKPDALFIVDSHFEDLAVKEALVSGVETIGVVDTNADPYLIDYPIPANDDAVGSISLIVTHILDAFAEGAKSAKDEKQVEGSKPKVQSKTENLEPKIESEKPKPQKAQEGQANPKVPAKPKTDSKLKTKNVKLKKTTK